MLAADVAILRGEDPLSQGVPFAIALGLGLLVGIERERSRAADARTLPGGIRTFPLVAIVGCSAAWAGVHLGPAAFVVISAAFGALVVASYVLSGLLGGDHGMATALASVVTYVVGVMAYHDHAIVASAIAVTTTALLSLRGPLHELAKRIEQPDLYATLKLAALTLVVLPVLPDQDFGPEPYRLLNPFRAWLLVVLIAGISFLGYVGTKLLGAGRGIVVTGALGGVVSSTAVTLSLSGKSRATPELSRALALGIAIAWATTFVRVLLEVAVLNAELLPLVAPTLGASMLAGLGGAAVLFWHARQGTTPDVAYQNPFALLPAFKFAGIFLAVLFLARFAQLRFQEPGVLVAAALSGTVDVDAVVLSVTRLARAGGVSPEAAAQAISISVGTNVVIKALLAAVLGAGALRRALLLVTAATLGAGLLAFLAAR